MNLCHFPLSLLLPDILTTDDHSSVHTGTRIPLNSASFPKMSFCPAVPVIMRKGARHLFSDLAAHACICPCVVNIVAATGIYPDFTTGFVRVQISLATMLTSGGSPL